MNLTDYQLNLIENELGNFQEEIESSIKLFPQHPRETLQDILRNITSLQDAIQFMLLKMNQKETA